MSVLLDTGVVFGWINRDDVRHDDCTALMDAALSGKHGALLCTDYVLDEGLTLIQRRTKRIALTKAFAAALASDSPIVRLSTGDDVLREAQDLFFLHWKRRLSLTDCTLIVHARQSGAKLATLDGGFDGLVDVLRA